MEEKRLFLLDAYALIFRAYYALIKMPRITSAGFNTSAIFGFVNTLEEILSKENPTHIAVCFDPSGPTFRSEAYEEYKGERDSTPEDIKLSVPIIKEIIRAYNIPVLEVEGFEADDVIGTMAKRAAAQGYTVYMMTPDKDFGQLVGENILQFKPSYRGQDFELRGEKEVCERYGIQRPEQVIDLLALAGDKIDNIPGCPGVGEKRAKMLIDEFGDVETLLANTDKLKGALQRNIQEHSEQIRFSRFLATIRTDVPLTEEPADLQRHAADTSRLFAIFAELEFRTLRTRVEQRLNRGASASAQPSLLDLIDGADEPTPATPTATISADNSKYILAPTPQERDDLNARLAACNEVGLYIAADGENDMGCTPIGAAVATAGEEALWLDFDDPQNVAMLCDLLGRRDICKVTSQAKRDMVVMHRLRRDDQPPMENYYDVSLAHYLLQPDMRHAPENISEAYLHYTMLDPYALGRKRSGKGADDWMGRLPRRDLARYCCEYADISLRLAAPLREELKKEGMVSLMTDIELPLAAVLADMEITGVRLDADALHQAAVEITAMMADLEKEIYELAGTKFKIDSPSQVGEILFDRLKLDDKAKKTKTGQYSTSEDILEKVAPKHPIVGKILQYRQLKKLYTTYLTTLPDAINPVTHKVHTNYNQTVASTGRLSSSNPNLQNIPVRDNEGRQIRKAFIADPDHLFLSADYSQIELRLVADFAEDEVMLDAFRHQKDIHAITASKIYHVPLEEVTAEQRRRAKTANFGILYGISAFGLAQRLGIPRAEAKELIDNYFATFPRIHKYMSDSVENARENGYVSTPWHRKRRLPDINSKNPVVRGYAERNAINAPLQGFAADIIKRAMIDIHREMQQRGLKSKMIMQVHDELNFDVVPDELPVMQEMVSRLMAGAFSGKVPLEASTGVALNWHDAH